MTYLTSSGHLSSGLIATGFGSLGALAGLGVGTAWVISAVTGSFELHIALLINVGWMAALSPLLLWLGRGQLRRWRGLRRIEQRGIPAQCYVEQVKGTWTWVGGKYRGSRRVYEFTVVVHRPGQPPHRATARDGLPSGLTSQQMFHRWWHVRLDPEDPGNAALQW